MRRFLKWAFGLTVVALAALLFALPRYAPRHVEQWAEETLARAGVDADVELAFGYCWRNGPGVSGRLSVSVPGTPWHVKTFFGASCCEWSARVTMPETSFSETDPLLASLLARHPLSGVSNLVFSGSVALDAQVTRTFHTPVPVWQANVPIKNVRAELFSNGKPYAIEGLSVTPSTSGIADHADIHPLRIKAQAADVSGFALTNLYASVRKTERAWIVDAAEAEFCGGKVNVYALYLDPATLNTGFTLFLDNIEAGQMLTHVGNFCGEASGRLHGKLKAFVKEGGRSLRLRDAFLYSTPGQTGKLRMENPEALTENLAYAGLDGATRANISDALTDLDYKVLRLDLTRLEGNAARLTVQVSGTATRGKTTVPVDLTVNINGELEQLINAGLGYSAFLKGTKKR